MHNRNGIVGHFVMTFDMHKTFRMKRMVVKSTNEWHKEITAIFIFVSVASAFLKYWAQASVTIHSIMAVFLHVRNNNRHNIHRNRIFRDRLHPIDDDDDDMEIVRWYRLS